MDKSKQHLGFHEGLTFTFNTKEKLWLEILLKWFRESIGFRWVDTCLSSHNIVAREMSENDCNRFFLFLTNQ